MSPATASPIAGGGNQRGQLGVGLPVGTGAYTPLPVINSANLGLITVNNGFFTTCGLDAGGAVYCWGYDGGGFGNGSIVYETFPTPTLAAGGMTLATIEVGSLHVCGLDDGGSAYCWGRRNLHGEQGIGSTAPVSSPTAVLGGHTFAQIDTDDTNRSWKSVCGVTTSNEAWCWGNNSYGNLGGPSTETCLLDHDCSTTPVPVSGGIDFASVSVGADHACGLSLDGSVFCWGNNDHGELGDGTLTGSPVPVPVVFPTPEQSLASLMDDVQGLLEDGILQEGEANALTSKLDAALKQAEAGKTIPAINQLDAFINQVNALVESGRLGEADARALIDGARSVIEKLTEG